MRLDGNGCPISNMDDLTVREEGGDAVFYDCYGNVFARHPKTTMITKCVGLKKMGFWWNIRCWVSRKLTRGL
jgi:hypothetical protein